MRDMLGTMGRRVPRIGLLSAVLLLLSGCGSSSGTVSGKVTYKGNPVPGGRVVFYGPNDYIGASPIDADGSYIIAKVPAGQPMQITVDTSTAPGAPSPGKGARSEGKAKQQSPTGQMKNIPDLPEAAKNNPIYGGGSNRYVKIPDKYADKDKSGLSYTTTRGKQTKDIPLE